MPLHFVTSYIGVSGNVVASLVGATLWGVYYVVSVVSSFESFDDALAKQPAMIAAHVKRSQELHNRGTLLMAGAFLNNPAKPHVQFA